MTDHHSEPCLGAYGFRLPDIAAAAGVLPVPASWPALRIVREHRTDTGDSPDPGTIRLDDRSATLWILHGDRIDIDRETLTARVATAGQLSDEALLHPYLGLPAAFASRWLGRQVLHGGAFLHGGRAWGVVADRAGGKSSTLASLHRRGVDILTDDLLMIEGEELYAGPRSIDLRAGPAEVMGGEAVGMLGARERWRVRPGEVPAKVRLGGFVHLEWGDELLTEPLGPAERLEWVVRESFAGPDPGDELSVLEIAGLPAWRLVRPHDLDGLERATTELLELLG